MRPNGHPKPFLSNHIKSNLVEADLIQSGSKQTCNHFNLELYLKTFDFYDREYATPFDVDIDPKYEIVSWEYWILFVAKHSSFLLMVLLPLLIWPATTSFRNMIFGESVPSDNVCMLHIYIYTCLYTQTSCIFCIHPKVLVSHHGILYFPRCNGHRMFFTPPRWTERCNPGLCWSRWS